MNYFSRTNFDRLKKIDYLIISIMIFFLLFPISIPHTLISFFEHPVVISSGFLIIVYLFFFYNPIIAILGIFFAYEMYRRIFKTSSFISTISNTKEDDHLGSLQNNNNLTTTTNNSNNITATHLNQTNNQLNSHIGDGSLEVDVVSKMAPINVSPSIPNSSDIEFQPLEKNSYAVY